MKTIYSKMLSISNLKWKQVKRRSPAQYANWMLKSSYGLPSGIKKLDIPDNLDHMFKYDLVRSVVPTSFRQSIYYDKGLKNKQMIWTGFGKLGNNAYRNSLNVTESRNYMPSFFNTAFAVVRKFDDGKPYIRLLGQGMIISEVSNGTDYLNDFGRDIVQNLILEGDTLLSIPGLPNEEKKILEELIDTLDTEHKKGTITKFESKFKF